MNYLLASLPPVWRQRALRLPVNVESVFDRLFIERPEVRRTVRELRYFLASKPPSRIETRQQREALIDRLLDELVSMANELQQTLPAGGRGTSSALSVWRMKRNCGSIHYEQNCPMRRILPASGFGWTGLPMWAGALPIG